MNAQEAVILLRKIRALCPSQKMDEYGGPAWSEAMPEITLEEASEAVVSIIRQPLPAGKHHYVEPAMIIAEVRRIKIVNDPDRRGQEWMNQAWER